MRIRQLFDEGHRRIRVPEWNERAYLQLHEYPGLTGTTLGVWADLHDPNGMRAIRTCEADENKGERFKLPRELIYLVDSDEWEPYTGPEDDFNDY